MERLQKVIARAGIASRRGAEELIQQGRVTVNGETVTRLGVTIEPDSDRVTVDGVPLPRNVSKVYLLLNKPVGFITALSDPAGRPVVTDLVKRHGKRVFPVGRLDFDAEGALILTNDGDLAERLIHPKYKVPKRYHAKVKGAPDTKDIKRLEKGVYLEDGKTLPATVRFIKGLKENSWIELTVFEGRNRLVKRMCLAVGHAVLKLKRVEFAGIGTGSMKPGEHRFLTKSEIALLKEWNVESDKRGGRRRGGH
ncbi:MAG: rRNA pseudouridine synthase, partial [Zetaproteobacteria bacterium]|nr:rRNA pseudouridine synthase [Zetaproteobacteria bacterium]